MPFNIVIAPTDEVYYTPAVKSGDFAYMFRRGTTRYLALERAPNHGFGVNDFPFKPAIISSPDGITWTLEDSGNTVEGIGDLGPAYDCRFDGSADTLSCFYDAERTSPSLGTFDYIARVADFDFATLTWSTRADLPLSSSPSMARVLFSSRPDGKYVLVINRASQAEYAVLDGSSWSGFTTIAAGSAVALLVASDNVMHVNVAGTHYAIDAAGAVLSSEAMPFGQGPMRVKSGALTAPALDASTLVIARGTPPNAAVWTTELVDAEEIFGGAVLVTESPAKGVDIAFTYDNSSPAPHTEIETGVIALAAPSSVLAMYWISNDSLDIMRSQRVGGVWSAPASVFTSAAGFLSILGIPDYGAQVGARYYAE